MPLAFGRSHVTGWAGLFSLRDQGELLRRRAVGGSLVHRRPRCGGAAGVFKSLKAVQVIEGVRPVRVPNGCHSSPGWKPWAGR